jgi:hypothetical protein
VDPVSHLRVSYPQKVFPGVYIDGLLLRTEVLRTKVIGSRGVYRFHLEGWIVGAAVGSPSVSDSLILFSHLSSTLFFPSSETYWIDDGYKSAFQMGRCLMKYHYLMPVR